MSLNPAIRTDDDVNGPISRVAELSLTEKIGLLTGAGTWTLRALPRIGLRTVTVSDGPIGVRGMDDDPTPSAQLPAPSATAASWDADLLGRLGTLMADEARRRGVDVILAPVVNLQRSPVGGRHFECLSEDPWLTARMAVPFVAAIQAEGIGACVKHFVGNETETDRTDYLSRIDERTLREVYLAPFEAVVRETGVWSIMAAYNGLSALGEESSATANTALLTDILKDEWRYDGVVVSDWLATTSTVESAVAGLDLVMPGPGGPWEQHLDDAVRRGEVPVGVIDDKVARLLLLASRVGALGEAFTPLPGESEFRRAAAEVASPDSAPVRALLREAAARSTVVLRNEAILPLDGDALGSVALIGANAVHPFVQGGGSAHVDAPLLADPFEALCEALPNALITLHRGGSTLVNAPVVDDDDLSAPSGERGVVADILDASGAVLESRLLPSASGSLWTTGLPAAATTVRFRTRVALRRSGEHLLEIAPVGAHTVAVDGTVVSTSAAKVGAEVVLDSSYANPPAVAVRVPGGSRRSAEIDATAQVVDAAAFGRFARIHLRHLAPEAGTDAEIAEAVEAARAADVAVVVVGTNPETESEGWDRPTLALPGRQNELVRRVAEANPRTVVVVNAGAPVLLPWLDEVPAVLWWWLPGQEAGTSLADVLLGTTEPAGRLPWTLPAAEADVPVPNGIPIDGYIDYAEGVDVGHRAWDRLGRTPAREFGYGLGYGRWRYDTVEADEPDEDGTVTVRVTVANEADRDAREVVQLYLEPERPDAERPLRWLAGFATVDVPAGASATVEIVLPERAFQTWNVDRHHWTTPSTGYRLHAARSSRDHRLATRVIIGGPTADDD
ncbi:beta-glucosidase family protein [Leifsonia poae]|uniref:beta-glucosidase family protein n=1 Tax=Leifsonia poae TaxID=110933 RepID=UPI001CBDFFED|nr:glycoside hydrolase family 3 C-terminal domain-containing protein [Leifsonia poae]